MALTPLVMAVARDQMPAERQSSAIALLSVTTVAGLGLGYPLTALVADLCGLRTAYGLGLALTIVTSVLAWRFVPRSEGGATARLDWTGALLLSAGVTALLLPLSQSQTWGWTSLPTLGLGAAGILLFTAWVGRSLKPTEPLVDLRLAVRPGLDGPNLVGLLAGIGMYALLTLGVLLVGTTEEASGFGLGESAMVTGLSLVPYSLMSVLGNRAARATSRRMGTPLLLPIGCGTYLVASVGMALAHDHLWQGLLWLAVGGVGSGFTISSLPALMVPHVPTSETSSALAFNLLLRNLGMTVGSVLGVGLINAFGGGESGFRDTFLVVAGL